MLARLARWIGRYDGARGVGATGTFFMTHEEGEPAGELTESGAKLLDPTARLRPGVVTCPPEGDAGTGMVATDAVAPRA